jgi:hypothetical protein
MRMESDKGNDASAVEHRLLGILREEGPQTLETLCALPGSSWAEVLLAVDRLSRTGAVAIGQLARCEYQVSLNGPAV